MTTCTSYFCFWKVQGFHEARESFGKVQKYNGMLDCFRVILKEEGSTGFFKGLAPSTIKVKKIEQWYVSNTYIFFLKTAILSIRKTDCQGLLEVVNSKCGTLQEDKTSIFFCFSKTFWLLKDGDLRVLNAIVAFNH